MNKTFNQEALKTVINELQITEEQAIVTLNLLDEGATIPFIARYRQGQTQGLNEEQIQHINEIYIYNVELNKRKESIIEILKERDLLNEEILKNIKKATTKSELENIYEPFKIGKKTKASEAIQLGLELLALSIFNETNPKFNPFKEAEKYLNDKVSSTDFAIEQAKFIISQIISQDITTREYVKNQLINFGTIVTKIKKNAEDEKKIFEKYYDYSEKVKFIKNHRILAISRAENKKIVSYDIQFNEKKILFDLNNKYFKIKTTGKILNEALIDSLERLIYPSIIREIKSDLFARAEKEAIKLFANNVEEMLLAPAIKNKKILAIDPGFKTGCKIALLDEKGNVLNINKIFLFHEYNKNEKLILNLIKDYKIDIIVIGNGTASRETEELIAKIVKSNNLNLKFALVSEIGASVYSASEVAIQEFPNLSVEERSAINIGRKFQDPLNELVKIDPKSIGVGQYQHDLNQKELEEQLKFKVDKVVNLVGVNLNTATKSILTYVSGLSAKIAQSIIDYRNEIKEFSNRKELLNVKGLGKKSYEQAIGFLRIFNSKEYFDKTSVHPESYELAYKIVKKLNLNLNRIDTEYLENVNKEELAQDLNTSIYDINLILEALINPLKDIRDEKEGLILKNEIMTFDDLNLGYELEGNILNITDFGIFVFIGIKESVLIHSSKIPFKNFKEILKPNQKITLKIIEIDKTKHQLKGEFVK
ncbi:helix-hairpin-helix domain-containing protein [Mycoplasmopsis gallinarum]|uniref:Putative RNA-binding protein n=1 Tax=Mycoplasmopsis gallinarum TaxID=29557 RepID=A0A168RHB3_9BACT|nr:Tex-like N-terminal domain-containing protein [Mycoplasmopsis gallinarum]OAB48987.1 putative RNA-binding protein [Mycoplasmopsis gallinarum]